MEFAKLAILRIYYLLKKVANWLYLKTDLTEEDNVDKNDGESKNNDKERETKQRVPFNEGQSSMVPLGIIKYTVPLANRQVPQLSDPSKRRHKIHEDGIIKRSGVKTVNEFNELIFIKSDPKWFTKLLETQTTSEQYLYDVQDIYGKEEEAEIILKNNFDILCPMAVETRYSKMLESLSTHHATNLGNFHNSVWENFTSSESEEEELTLKSRKENLKRIWNNQIFKASIKNSGFISVEDNDSSDESNTTLVEDVVNGSLIKYITNCSQKNIANETANCSNYSVSSAEDNLLNKQGLGRSQLTNNDGKSETVAFENYVIVPKSSNENNGSTKQNHDSKKEINFTVTLAEMMIPWFKTRSTPKVQLKSAIGNRRKILKKKIIKTSLRDDLKLKDKAEIKERQNILPIICSPANDCSVTANEIAKMELKGVNDYQITSETLFNCRLYFDQEKNNDFTSETETASSEENYFDEEIIAYEKSLNTVD
ncbi:uncharacterized protein isoform X2 [Rhodnius prolixus]|uniref:uncharacterized protein isoform X2 n=1 Tax=Rhodnius prolixus TaxID=13249 RepID=UPI003D187890